MNLTGRHEEKNEEDKEILPYWEFQINSEHGSYFKKQNPQCMKEFIMKNKCIITFVYFYKSLFCPVVPDLRWIRGFRETRESSKQCIQTISVIQT